MVDFANTVTEPSYISQLALHSAPFSKISEPGLFFSAGQAEHRLKLLLHLLRSTDKVANLVAKSGCGKTTLLKQLTTRVGDEVRLCLLNADEYSDNTALLAYCLTSFGIASEDIAVATDPIALLKQRLEQFVQLGIRPVLIIDNVEQLDNAFVTELSSWFHWQFAGKHLLSAILTSAKPVESEISDRLQVIELPAMSESEVASYIMYRLQAVGFQQDSLFSDKELQQIYQQSEGNAALVNRLANQRLLDIKPSPDHPRSLKAIIYRIFIRWFGLGFVLIVLLLLFVFQETVSNLLPDDKPTKDDSDPYIIENDKKVPATVDLTQEADKDEQAQRDELASLLAEIPDVEQPSPVAQPVQQPAINNTTYGIDWIVRQPETAYTFQLMGSWDKNEITDFIKRYALEGDVAVFESMRNQRVWYVLLYGKYKDKSSAISASEGWPGPLDTAPSWLRRFNSVQQQIKNNAVIGQKAP